MLRVTIFCTFLNWCLSCILLQVFKECYETNDSGNTFELSLIGFKSIGAYIENKKNQNQAIICHLFIIYTFFPRILNWFADKIYTILCAWCRFAGYGKKSNQKMIEDFSSSWILFSTNLVAYFAMSVSLDQDLWALEELVSLFNHILYPFICFQFPP